MMSLSSESSLSKNGALAAGLFFGIAVGWVIGLNQKVLTAAHVEETGDIKGVLSFFVNLLEFST